jgi:hypothetical protein
MKNVLEPNQTAAHLCFEILVDRVRELRDEIRHPPAARSDALIETRISALSADVLALGAQLGTDLGVGDL